MGAELKEQLDEWQAELREALASYIADKRLGPTEAGEGIARARKNKVSRSTVGRLLNGRKINPKKARELESFLSTGGYYQRSQSPQ